MIYKRGDHRHLDVVVNGVRYREALRTTDRREALGLEKKRVSEIHQGRGASLAGREFARKSFSVAANQFLEDRKPHVAERTFVLERNLLNPLRAFLGDKQLLRIRAEDVTAYQRSRRETGISGRTLNMEIGVLRRIMKRARVWTVLAEDVRMDRESTRPIGKALTAEQKQRLFDVAGNRPEWMVAQCAAVLAVSTTSRGVELKHLRGLDVDLFAKEMSIRRSKTEAGHRTIPLNGDAMTAIARLRGRAEIIGSGEPDHFVFPSCQRHRIDPSRPQKSWRSAWRSLVKETAKSADRDAAKAALDTGCRISGAKAAWTRAAAAFRRLRFHDLRHQAITELAENGAPDATLMALADHLSHEMMEHYSHVRMAAKRFALAKLESGLMKPGADPTEPVSKTVN